MLSPSESGKGDDRIIILCLRRNKRHFPHPCLLHNRLEPTEGFHHRFAAILRSIEFFGYGWNFVPTPRGHAETRPLDLMQDGFRRGERRTHVAMAPQSDNKGARPYSRPGKTC